MKQLQKHSCDKNIDILLLTYEHNLKHIERLHSTIRIRHTNTRKEFIFTRKDQVKAAHVQCSRETNSPVVLSLHHCRRHGESETCSLAPLAT